MTEKKWTLWLSREGRGPVPMMTSKNKRILEDLKTVMEAKKKGYKVEIKDAEVLH